MSDKNFELSAYLLKKQVYKYELAEAMGIADSSLSRMLRKEIPDEEKQHLFHMIDDIVRSKQGAFQGGSG